MTASNSGQGVRILEVDASGDGQRIDNFLLRELRGVPRSRVYRLLRRGEVRVNRGRVKAEHRLQRGDQVRIPPLRMAEPAAQPAGLPDGLGRRLAAAVLYEDDGLLVVDKPSGLAVHGGSGLRFGLIEAFRQLRPDLPGLELVHRLDRETSGCLLLAKRRPALRELHAALREGRMEKRYLALVSGQWPQERREVALPLERNILRSGERMVRTDDAGKASLTRFSVQRSGVRASLVEAEPVTGRTHQIRVHAAAMGHPILGDDKYGDREHNAWARALGLKRLFLHAHSLALDWGGQRLVFVAELPGDLHEFAEKVCN